MSWTQGSKERACLTLLWMHMAASNRSANSLRAWLILSGTSRILLCRNSSSLHNKLQDSREGLVSHMQAMHTRRLPWGISLFNLQERLIGIPEPAQVSPGITANQARELTTEAVQQLKDDIRHWIDLEGPYLSDRYPEWMRSNVSTPDDAREAFALARTMANEKLPEAERLMQSLVEETGVSLPRSPADWLALLEWFDELQKFQQRLGSGIYHLDLESICTELAPASGWSAFFAGILSSLLSRCKETSKGSVDLRRIATSPIVCSSTSSSRHVMT